MRIAPCFSRLFAPSALARIVGLCIGLAGVAAPLGITRADELQDVSKLVAGSKLDDAEKRADAFLAKNPKDAQMRFLKGTILTQRGKRDEAIRIYTGITEDYPELPEPWNNLAVIYAAQGAYDKARDSLETAIRVTPNYATAHENLGDVYAALAAQSYQNARRYDANNAPALRKLNAARVLLGGNGAPASAAAAPAASSASASSTSAAVSSPRSQRNVGLPAPAGAPAAVAGVGATAPDVVIPANAASVPSGSNIVAIENAPAANASSSAASSASSGTSTIAIAASSVDQRKPPADPASPIADVTAAVKRWAASRSVQVDDLKVRVDGDTAVARFRETAQSPRRVSNKLLTFKQNAGDWTITGEKAEP